MSMFTTPRKIPGQTDYDEEEHVADLKSPRATIGLTEPHCGLAPKPESEGKRRASPMESSPSNNRSSRGDEIYEEMYNDFTQMKRQYEVLYQRASSRPTVPRDPIREIMDILDDLIGSLESGIPIFERVITSPTRIGHKCS
jgi:hypothetical protein